MYVFDEQPFYGSLSLRFKDESFYCLQYGRHPPILIVDSNAKNVIDIDVKDEKDEGFNCVVDMAKFYTDVFLYNVKKSIPGSQAHFHVSFKTCAPFVGHQSVGAQVINSN